MKNIIYSLFLIFLVHYNVKAQTIEIPDEVLKTELLNDPDINTNGDDEIQLSEAQSATQLYIDNNFVNSISGLENFENLKELSLQIESMESVDLSFYPDLTYLAINANLSEIDLSHNTKLEWVVINRPNHLTSLDVSQNTELIRLHVSSNELTSIDLSSNPKLEQLTINDNELNTLDVSDNPLLSTLECYGNNLSTLDVSENEALAILWCYDNQLTSLDLTNNTELLTVKCYSNLLEELDVSASPDLFDVECYDNRLTSLEVHPNLSTLICNNNELTDLDLSENEDMGYLNCTENPNLQTICVYDAEEAANNTDFMKDESADWADDCGLVTGKEELVTHSHQLYPNPAMNVVHFGENVEDVVIYSASGEIVLRGSHASADVSSLPEGIYHVKITDSNNKTFVQKLIKK